MSTKCSDCCHPAFVNSEFCGCCEGIEVLTPLPTANRPGLSELAYRIGTHGSFLETMKARLSSTDFPELKALTTRESDDPSIALLDAWATVADVLSFYQERIANEGYLRTAVERRSILELARLVGYKLRPGVASSVFLAYTIDENTKEEVTIPAGSRAQSVPGPDDRPQSFETSEALKARAKWNNLQPRLTRPQTAASIRNNKTEQTVQGPRIYLKSVSTNLKPNDPLLIDFGTGDSHDFHRVKGVEPDAAADRTLVTLQVAAGNQDETLIAKKTLATQGGLIKELTLPPSIQPRNALRLARKLKDQFSTKAETGYAVVGAFAPVLRETLATAAANAAVTFESQLKVYALRLEAHLFGYNVPKRTKINRDGSIEIIGDWPLIEDLGEIGGRVEHEKESALHLDARYEEVLPGSWVVVQTQDTRLTDPKILKLKAKQVDFSLMRSEYGITAPTTRIELGTKWIELADKGPSRPEHDDFNALRSTIVYAKSEELELAEEPINFPVCGGTDELIELDSFYEGLEAGRWVIVSGERDIEGTSGVRFSELAMLSSVSQKTELSDTSDGGALPGDKIHTYIKLANKLSYCFKRDTVRIYGNVVKATHGETRTEVLGSGDASKALQSFELKQAPLTFVPASNPSGVDSTLNVFVNDLRWHEADSLVGLQPTDRSFITKTNDEQKTTIVFGNGGQGARPPTGVENIQAEYRSGLGKPGNVRAEQIMLLATKPLGVKEVINPLRASGGADRESRDQARKNAPLAVKALDRLVSVQDYEDFARVYAGIGKALAVELSDGRRQLVHVTVAGADDIPIDEHSDLFQNLHRALHDFGDLSQPIQLAVRELMLIVISANVRILPDYRWEPVVTGLRAALLDAFSFERRELGQDVLLSEVISVMQKVRGVAYVDVDAFGGIPEKIEKNGKRSLLTPDEITKAVRDLIEAREKTNRPEQRVQVNKAVRGNDAVHPAQLAFLSPELPATLILNRRE